MIVAFISIALVSQFGSPLVIPVGDRAPVIKVEKTCRDTVAANKETNVEQKSKQELVFCF
jgi:hypothetical protein